MSKQSRNSQRRHAQRMCDQCTPAECARHPRLNRDTAIYAVPYKKHYRKTELVHRIALEQQKNTKRQSTVLQTIVFIVR
ncbi:unnamed protein product [Euphydryas editha]|uniref:Uncharacterized protein n=1 Tax=Euphydryas editha TaxID=104508 RepID=A0AAU9V3K5_EUPED|nr:unnamed protein product [Euphydryas editha]